MDNEGKEKLGPSLVLPGTEAGIEAAVIIYVLFMACLSATEGLAWVKKT